MVALVPVILIAGYVRRDQGCQHACGAGVQLVETEPNTTIVTFDTVRELIARAMNGGGRTRAGEDSWARERSPHLRPRRG